MSEDQTETVTMQAEEVDSERVGTDKVLTIRVPGSVSHLGPAFDTVAIAVKLYLTIQIEIEPPDNRRHSAIIPKGSIAQQLPLDNTNHIARVMQKLWPQNPAILSALKITIDSDIPMSRGLGSSAAATVAGATGVMALCGQPLQKGNIYYQAAELEGYANNACASVFGGFTICGQGATADDFLARKIIWPENWHLIATIPPYSVGSKKARRVVPASISHKDAVFNVQRAALLIEAVAAGDAEAMRFALRDKLHEPFQSKLVPEFSEVKRMLQGCGVLGTVLSGGGSCIITIAETELRDEVVSRLQDWTRSQKDQAEVVELPIDDEGLLVTCE